MHDEMRIRDMLAGMNRGQVFTLAQFLASLLPMADEEQPLRVSDDEAWLKLEGLKKPD